MLNLLSDSMEGAPCQENIESNIRILYTSKLVPKYIQENVAH